MERSILSSLAPRDAAIPRPSVLQRLLEDEVNRPAVGWENLEDVIYHDTLYGDRRLDESPELVAFMQKVWTFNTAMTWVGPTEAGNLFAYSATDLLWLTGQGQVSAWHTAEANSLSVEGNATCWTRGTSRRRDGLVLPTFQVHRNQHPRLRFAMLEADAEWQVVIAVKGRAGRPLWHSDWLNGEADIEVDVDSLLSEAGYEHQYAELHIAVVAWESRPGGVARLKFEASFKTQPAVVAPYPIIRTLAQVQTSGVAIEALLVNADGAVVAESASVRLDIGEQARVLEPLPDGTWRSDHFDSESLPVGTHPFVLSSDNSAASASGSVRITDGQFYQYDPQNWLVSRGSAPARPISGSYCASAFVVRPGEPDEKPLVGQPDWNDEVVALGSEERVHHWDSWTEAELESRFAYVKSKGWDLLHLHQHWSSWSRLDAGGHLSPRGAEHAALYYRVADQYGLAVMQSLVDYPYGVADDRTAFNPDLSAPWKTYLDAGFEEDHWYSGGGSPFRTMLEQYVREYVTVFNAETGVFGFSHSGEADFMSGSTAVNRSGELLRELGSNHLYYSEPCFRVVNAPRKHVEGFDQELVGGRTYWIGGHIAPHDDMNVELALMSMDRIFVAEGSWAPANTYARLHLALADRWGSRESWTGSIPFRLRLRDTLYLALIRGMPLTVTWDEQVTEDEHEVFAEVSREIDWAQPTEPAPYLVVVTDDHMTGIGRELLAQASRWFTSHGLSFELATTAQNAAPSQEVIELRGQFAEPALGGSRSLPKVGRGYQLAHTTKVDGTVVGYLHNSGRTLKEYFQPGNHLHRIPVVGEANVRLPLRGGAAQQVRVYDLTTKTLLLDTEATEVAEFDRGFSTHDYLLLVTRKG